MAMTMKTEGLTELSEMISSMADRAEDVATGALFDGAAVVATAYRNAIGRIVTEPFHYLARPDLTGTKRYASPEEKAALMGKSGIAEFRKNGSEVDTLIGITGSAGYANIGGKAKAVRMIARSINSGTSFMQKQPFARLAKSSSQGVAKAAMVAKAEEMLQELIK